MAKLNIDKPIPKRWIDVVCINGHIFRCFDKFSGCSMCFTCGKQLYELEEEKEDGKT